MKVVETKIDPTACIECGHVSDVSTSFDDDPPAKPGDFTICVECSALMAYGEDLKLRALTEEEMRAVAGSPELKATLALVAASKPHPDDILSMPAAVMPKTECPECGATGDRAANPDGHKPKPGDWSLCVDCSALSAFADDLTLRPLTEDEMTEAAGDPQLVAASRVLARWKKDREGAKE